MTIMRASGNHSWLDLYEKARGALGDRRTIRIAMTADSPTSGENTARRGKFGRKKRISTAALVRLRNMSFVEFWFIPQVLDTLWSLDEFERGKILAELPEAIRTALVASRKN